VILRFRLDIAQYSEEDSGSYRRRIAAGNILTKRQARNRCVRIRQHSRLLLERHADHPIP
jgi:hypothetical protein